MNWKFLTSFHLDFWIIQNICLTGSSLFYCFKLVLLVLPPSLFPFSTYYSLIPLNRLHLPSVVSVRPLAPSLICPPDASGKILSFSEVLGTPPGLTYAGKWVRIRNCSKISKYTKKGRFRKVDSQWCHSFLKYWLLEREG